QAVGEDRGEAVEPAFAVGRGVDDDGGIGGGGQAQDIGELDVDGVGRGAVVEGGGVGVFDRFFLTLLLGDFLLARGLGEDPDQSDGGDGDGEDQAHEDHAGGNADAGVALRGGGHV